MASVLPASAAALLGPEGPFAKHRPGFRVREGQRRMAAAVEAAIAEGHHLLVEAGTGIGKTFAYLVPAVLSGRRVVISTATRALQDQLFHRDLPAVCEILGVDPRAALLKGRGNYLCHHRFERLLARGVRSRDDAERLERLDGWRWETPGGDLAECDFLPEDWVLRRAVTSTAENCLGQRCLRWERCLVERARSRALQARIVVVNHDLLLADLRLREEGFGCLLAPPEVVIVDEAHALADKAFASLGTQLSSGQLRELLRDLEAATDLAGRADLRASLEPDAAALEAALDAALRALAAAGEGRLEGERLAQEPGVAAALLALGGALGGLADAIGRLGAGDAEFERLGERAAELGRQLEDWRRAAESSRLAPGEPAEATCAWGESAEQGFRLCLAPLEVGERLARWREALRAPWIFTSATLSVGGSFAPMRRALGLLEDVVCELVPSAFDYPALARLFVPQGFPDPGDRVRHRRAFLALARRLIAAARGRAFLLFTSHEALREAARSLASESAAGRFPWPLLVQGERSHQALLREFRDCGNAVLLGTASFWEGVDVVGPALSLVVIDKLPFAAPADPLRRARTLRIRERGGDPFLELDLPEAVLALKQGAGRLIRSESDRGLLVITDPRLHTAGYRRAFLDSLPPMGGVDSEEEALEFLRAL